MLAIAKYGSRKRRVDADGDRWHVTNYFKMTGKGEECARFFTVKVTKPFAAIGRLPGASEALAADRRYRAWEAERAAERLQAAYVQQEGDPGPIVLH
jgi:hypothetical protein